jgi:hypothetical protein
MHMAKIIKLLKWVLIVDGITTLLNFFGVVIFLTVRGNLNFQTFVQLFLSFLMLEGLIIALVGCISYLGFEKYKFWIKGYSNTVKEMNSKSIKIDFRLVFLVSGVLLFFVTLSCASVMP